LLFCVAYPPDAAAFATGGLIAALVTLLKIPMMSFR